MYLKVLMGLALGLLAPSCGETHFKSNGGGQRTFQQPALPETRPPAEPKPASMGDAGPQFPQGKPQTERFSLNSIQKSQPVDIIFVVDTSPSMAEEKALLEQKMSYFIQTLTQSQNLDYKLYMIGENFNFPQIFDFNRFVKINREVGSWDALNILSDFLVGMLGNPPRMGSTRHAVIITDDDAGRDRKSGLSFGFGGSSKLGITAGDFRSRIGFNIFGQNKLHMHGFVGLRPGRNNSWCNIQAIGHEYMSLSKDPQFKGQIQDLCNSDWNTLLGNLASQIQQFNQPTSYRLRQRIDMSKPLTITANGVAMAPFDYQINPQANTVNLTNVQNLPANAFIQIEYVSLP